jgi:hypothetical protein
MYLDKPGMKKFGEIELLYHMAVRTGLCASLNDCRVVEFFSHPLVKKGRLKFIDLRDRVKTFSINDASRNDFFIKNVIKNDYETVFEWKEGICYISMTRQWQYLEDMASILDKFAFSAADWWNIAYYYMDFGSLEMTYPDISQLCRKRLLEYPEKELLPLRSPEFDLFLDKK